MLIGVTGIDLAEEAVTGVNLERLCDWCDVDECRILKRGET